MKIKWLLSMTAGIMALLGAESGEQTTAAKPPVVRTVEFKNFRGVSVKEIVNRLNDRDIQLVERPYSAEYVETAQGIVEELLAEKGQPGTHVKPTVTSIHASRRPRHIHRGALITCAPPLLQRHDGLRFGRAPFTHRADAFRRLELHRHAVDLQPEAPASRSRMAWR